MDGSRRSLGLPAAAAAVALAWCLLVMVLSGVFIIPASATHEIFPELQCVSVLNVKKVHRTGFHFQPPKHWINDPNGPMVYKGIYHLFYQYNPKGAVWGNIVWAHSVSRDLVNWKTLEPAIYPSKPFDIGGCWSGSATILPDGRPVILYTGLDKDAVQMQNYAIPSDMNDPYLRRWSKPDDNPLIYPSKDVNASAFRDPSTAWFSGGHWKTVIGSRHHHRGIVYMYRSKDFKHWNRVKHPFHTVPNTGNFECPDFFPVLKAGQNGIDTSAVGENVRHVLKVSLDETRYEYYTIGTYNPDKDKYVPDGSLEDGWGGLRLDYGNFYASKTFYDSGKGRRILWGWANESDSQANDTTKGWAGVQVRTWKSYDFFSQVDDAFLSYCRRCTFCQTIPRTMWLDSGGKQLVHWPVQEIETLRGNKVELQNVELKRGEHVEVKGITAAQADVEVVFAFSDLSRAEHFDPRWGPAHRICAQKSANSPGGLGPFGLMTLATVDFHEYTPVFFRIFKADNNKHIILLCSDARNSSHAGDLYKPAFGGFVNVDISHGKLSLRTLIDNSVVESFGAGGRTCITSRVYPEKATYDNARLFAFNHGSSPITVEKLSAWSMKNADRNIGGTI